MTAKEVQEYWREETDRAWAALQRFREEDCGCEARRSTCDDCQPVRTAFREARAMSQALDYMLDDITPWSGLCMEWKETFPELLGEWLPYVLAARYERLNGSRSS